MISKFHHGIQLSCLLILNFDHNSVSLNFSNHRFKVLINGDEILIDGKPYFKIVKKDVNVLIIKSGNEARKYASLKLRNR